MISVVMVDWNVGSSMRVARKAHQLLYDISILISRSALDLDQVECEEAKQQLSSASSSAMSWSSRPRVHGALKCG